MKDINLTQVIFLILPHQEIIIYNKINILFQDFVTKELMKSKKNCMDLSSIFAYILKIAILLMNSHIEIPDEIDEKLKKNHNNLKKKNKKK